MKAGIVGQYLHAFMTRIDHLVEQIGLGSVEEVTEILDDTDGIVLSHGCMPLSYGRYFG